MGHSDIITLCNSDHLFHVQNSNLEGLFLSKAKKIAALKKYMKVQVNDDEREKEILDKLDCEDYKPYKEQMTAIYKEIFQQMKDLEKD